ncbi:MAG: hypothetical protein HY554_03070 [Elusimicrobia bacterium]|nr:hypothetical protein [Elusimicrobiota bacterium]
MAQAGASETVDPEESCALAVSGGAEALERAQLSYAKLYQRHADAGRRLGGELESLDVMDRRLRLMGDQLFKKRTRVSDADQAARLDQALSENRRTRDELQLERARLAGRLGRHEANAKGCAKAGREMERLLAGRSPAPPEGRAPDKRYIVGRPKAYPVVGQHGNTCAIAAALPVFKAWGRPDVTEDELFERAWRKGFFTRPARIACETPSGETGKCTWDVYTGPDGKERARVFFNGRLRYEKRADSFIREEIRENGGTPRNMLSRLLVDFGLAVEAGREHSSFTLSQIAADTGLVERQQRRLQDALHAGRAVFVGVDAGALWNDPRSVRGGHAILITGIKEDARGNILGYYLNDSGAVPPRAGAFYSREAFETAWFHGGLTMTTVRRKE